MELDNVAISRLEEIAHSISEHFSSPCVVRNGELLLGQEQVLRITIEPRAFGLVAVIPHFDALGDITAVSTGPVRSGDDVDKIIADILERVTPIVKSREITGSSLQFSITRKIATHLARKISNIDGVVRVEARRDIHGVGGFEVDMIRVIAGNFPENAGVAVAENGAWAIFGNYEGPARDHAMIDQVVEDLIEEIQARNFPSISI